MTSLQLALLDDLLRQLRDEYRQPPRVGMAIRDIRAQVANLAARESHDLAAEAVTR